MRSAKGLQGDPFALRFFLWSVSVVSFHRTFTEFLLSVSPLPSPVEQSVLSVWLSAAYLLAYHAVPITTLSQICELPGTDGCWPLPLRPLYSLAPLKPRSTRPKAR